MTDKDEIIAKLEGEIEELKRLVTATYHDLSAVLLRIEANNGFTLTDRDYETLNIICEELKP